MMLAAELALAKVDVAVVERRPDHVLVGSRAGGFHSRTIEVLDQRGVADRFLAEGKVAQAAVFGTTGLDMSDSDASSLFARHMAEPDRADHGRVDRRAGGPRPITRREVTGFVQDDPASTSGCATASAAGRNISSAATEDAA